MKLHAFITPPNMRKSVVVIRVDKEFLEVHAIYTDHFYLNTCPCLSPYWKGAAGVPQRSQLAPNFRDRFGRDATTASIDFVSVETFVQFRLLLVGKW